MMMMMLMYNTAGRHKDTHTVSVRSSTAVLTGLPSGVTKKQIYKRCRKVGDVTNVTYPVDGRGSDTALVQYSNHQVATKAISALNGKTFKGMKYAHDHFIMFNYQYNKRLFENKL